MIQKFTFKTYIPTQSRYIRLRPIPGDVYFSIGKYIQNNDDQSVINTFRQVFDTYCEDDIQIEKTSVVDLFCMLLNMRIMSVSQTFDFEGTTHNGNEKVKQTQKLDLYDILDKVTNHPTNTLKTIDVNENCTIKMCMPKGLINNDIETLIVDVIDSVKILGKEYDMTDLPVEDKMSVLDAMPGDVLSLISRHVQQVDHEYRIKVFDRYDVGDLAKIELKLFDNSLFEFIKAMYNCNLQEQYYIRYIMVKRLGFTLKDVEEITPIDTTNYINLYREELEEERKANEKQSGKSESGMTLPSPGLQQ